MEWSRLAARHTGPHWLANSKRKFEKRSHKNKTKKRRREFFVAIVRKYNMQRSHLPQMKTPMARCQLEFLKFGGSK